MAQYTVFMTVAFTVEAADEVDALTQAQGLTLADGTNQNIQIMPGEHGGH